MLSEEAIKEYADIYKKEFGITLTPAEATEQATRLIQLFEVLLKIDRSQKKE